MMATTSENTINARIVNDNYTKSDVFFYKFRCMMAIMFFPITFVYTILTFHDDDSALDQMLIHPKHIQRRNDQRLQPMDYFRVRRARFSLDPIPGGTTDRCSLPRKVIKSIKLKYQEYPCDITLNKVVNGTHHVIKTVYTKHSKNNVLLNERLDLTKDVHQDYYLIDNVERILHISDLIIETE